MSHSFNKQPFPLRNKVRFELLYRFTVSKPIVFYGISTEYDRSASMFEAGLISLTPKEESTHADPAVP